MLKFCVVVADVYYFFGKQLLAGDYCETVPMSLGGVSKGQLSRLSIIRFDIDSVVNYLVQKSHRLCLLRLCVSGA